MEDLLPLHLRPTNKVVEAPEIGRKCGNCFYGLRVEIAVVECHGAPPSCQLLPVGKNLAGQQQMMLQPMRPRLPSNEPGCALWAADDGEQVKTVGNLPMEGRG